MKYCFHIELLQTPVQVLAVKWLSTVAMEYTDKMPSDHFKEAETLRTKLPSVFPPGAMFHLTPLESLLWTTRS